MGPSLLYLFLFRACLVQLFWPNYNIICCGHVSCKIDPPNDKFGATLTVYIGRMSLVGPGLVVERHERPLFLKPAAGVGRRRSSASVILGANQMSIFPIKEKVQTQ
jgi:hypothetical protein